MLQLISQSVANFVPVVMLLYFIANSLSFSLMCLQLKSAAVGKQCFKASRQRIHKYFCSLLHAVRADIVIIMMKNGTLGTTEMPFAARASSIQP
jgi:hypothetical protein